MARITLLSPIWRLVTATLIAIAWLTLPTYLLSLVLLPPAPPIVMIRSFIVGTALPFAMAWAVMRGFAGSITVRDGTLRLRRSDLEIDVPCAAIRRVRPWWISMPQPGLRLEVDHGRIPFGIAFDDPTPILDVLDACRIDTASARRHPSTLHAATKRPRKWWIPVLKFGAFGLLPAMVLFYTHQHIAYGGTFGQYYLESPTAYFTTFAEYWATTAILLMSYASFWRAAAEPIVGIVGAIAPHHGRLARKAVETLCALAYYAGVPALLALRYLSD